MRLPVRRFVVPLVALLSVTSDCTKSNGNFALGLDPGNVTAVVISPASVNIIAGYTAQLTAQVQFKAGLSGSMTVGWTTTYPLVATVNSAGLATGVGAGTTHVFATSDADPKFDGTATINVDSLKVSVNPVSFPLQAGQTQTFTCSATAPAGFTVPVEADSWTTDDHTVATVDPLSGLLTARSPGTTKVWCQYGPVTNYRNFATVSVSAAAPPTFALAAYPDAGNLNPGETLTPGFIGTRNGVPVPSSSVTLSSNNTAVATVIGQTITAVAQGAATVTATLSGSAASAASAGFAASGAFGAAARTISAQVTASVSVTIPVTVSATPTPAIVITPNPATIAVGGTAQLSATVNGAAPANPVGWFATDLGAVTTVNTAGLVTGVAPGATIIRGSFSVNTSSGLTLYNRASVVNVRAPAQACLPTGTYSFARTVEYDDANSQNIFINLNDPLALTFTVTGSAFTVAGPAPFIGGSGTIDSGCNLSMTATGTLYGIPNVNVVLSGALPATGASRLVYQMGGNGSLPRGFPVYYRLTF